MIFVCSLFPKAILFDFYFCYESDLMLSLSYKNQSDVFKAFNSTSRYLVDLLNIDYDHFDQMVDEIYPDLQLNIADASDEDKPFLDFNLSASNAIWILLTLVLLNPNIPCLCKQCRSRSVGFFRSQLIWICTVCH